MSGHTPGPWVLIPGGDEWSTGRVATIEPKPETMVDTNYWTVAEVNYRRDEHAANANLIAAAPCLLAALEQLVKEEGQSSFEWWLSNTSPSGCSDEVHSQWLESSEYHDYLDLYSDAIAAIARAKGEA